MTSIDKDGNTVIAGPILRRDVSRIRELLDMGIDVNIQNNNGDSALILAIKTNHTLEVIEWIIDAGASLDLQDCDGCTALFTAVVKGYNELAKCLIAAGANLDIQNKNLDTALMMACRCLQVEVVELLLEHGANPNIVKRYDHTAILMAMCSDFGNVSRERDHEKIKPVTKLLLEAGANTNCWADYNTPLMIAASRSDIELVELLLESGADINAINRYGCTALKRAINLCDMSIFKFLLDHGANINLQDNCGRSALHNISQKRRTRLHDYGANGRIKEILYQYMPNPHLQTRYRETARTIAFDEQWINILDEYIVWYDHISSRQDVLLTIKAIQKSSLELDDMFGKMARISDAMIRMVLLYV